MFEPIKICKIIHGYSLIFVHPTMPKRSLNIRWDCPFKLNSVWNNELLKILDITQKIGNLGLRRRVRQFILRSVLIYGTYVLYQMVHMFCTIVLLVDGGRHTLELLRTLSEEFLQAGENARPRTAAKLQEVL